LLVVSNNKSDKNVDLLVTFLLSEYPVIWAMHLTFFKNKATVFHAICATRLNSDTLKVIGT